MNELELDVSELAAELSADAPPPKSEESAQDLHDAYERDIAALGDDLQAVPLIYAQGRLLEDRLKQPHKAAACYERAVSRDPKYLPAICAARRLHAELGNWTQVAHLLALEARLTTDADALAAIHFERALLFEEKLNEPQKARDAYAEARGANPRSYVLDAMYYRHLAGAQDYLAAYDVLDAMAADVEDAPFRADLHRQLASISGVRLGHADVALAHQRAVLERDPDDPSARAALIRELHGSGSKSDLAHALSSLAVRAGDAAEAASMHYRAARIYREHLADEPQALRELASALQRQPDHALSLSELVSVYEAAHRWEELVAVLRQEVDVCEAAEDRAHRLFRLGQVFEEKLTNDKEALEYYRRVIEVRPGYLPALQALGKLYSRMGAWDDLAAMYEAEILATPEPVLKLPKLFKLAEVAETKLKNVERAMQIYEQMLDVEPQYLPALKALGRLYAADQRWDDLVKMYEDEIAAMTDDEAKVDLLERVAQIFEERVVDDTRAIATYQRILQMAPNNARALRSLAQLYLRTERWKEAIAINAQEIEQSGDQKKIISLLHKNGEVYEDKLQDKEHAIECYQQLLALAPNYLPALRSLGRLYLQKGRWQDLAAMYRQEIDVTQVTEQAAALHFKVGELMQEKLLDEKAAVEAYQEVLKLQPTHRQAIVALSTLYRARELWRELLDVLEQEAEATADQRQKSVRWCEVAELHEERLKDREGAIAAYESAVSADPDNVLAQQAMIRLLEGSDLPRAIKLLEMAVQKAHAPEQRLGVFLRLGSLYDTGSQDKLKAMAAYEGALSIAPGHTSATLALARLGLERRDYRRAITLLEQLAAATADPRLTVSFHLQAAAIKENHLDPPEPAIANYQAILAVEPSEAHALRALEVELHKAGDIAGLQRVYTQWSGDGGAMAATWLVERAELMLETPEASLEALVAPMEALLQSEPGNLRALRVLRRLCDRTHNWQGFLRATEQEGRLTRDAARAARLLTDVGNVQWQRLKDPALAKQTFLEALRRDNTQLAPFLALTELLSATQEWQELADILANRGGARGEFFVEAGAIYYTKLNHPEEARRCFEAALNRDPTRSDAHMALAEMAEQAAEWLSAVDHYSRAMSAQASGEQLATLHTRLARIYAHHLGDQTRATSHVRAALAAGLMDSATFNVAMEVLSKVGDFSAATTALTKMIARADDPEEKAKLYCQLGAMLMSGVKDEAAAMKAFESAHALSPGGMAVERLVEIYEKTGHWQRMVEMLRAMLPRVEDAKIKARMHARLSGVLAEQLKDYAAAAAEMKQAQAAQPDEVVYRERLGLLLAMSRSTLSEAAQQFRVLLEREPLRASALRALCRLSAQQGLHDKAFCFADVMTFIRVADGEEQTFFAQNRERLPHATTEVLSDVHALLDPDERPYTDILSALHGELTKLYAPHIDLTAVDKADRLGAKSTDPLRQLADGIARVFSPPEYVLALAGGEAQHLDIDNGDPLVLWGSRELGRRVAPEVQRFLLAEQLLALRAGHHVFKRRVGDISQFFWALCQAVSPSQDARMPEAVESLSKELAKALSRKAKKVLEGPVEALNNRRIDAAKLAAAMQRSELRAAILMAGEFEPVARVLAKRAGMTLTAPATHQEAQALFAKVPTLLTALHFYVSEEHFLLRKKLRLAVDS